MDVKHEQNNKLDLHNPREMSAEKLGSYHCLVIYGILFL